MNVKKYEFTGEEKYFRRWYRVRRIRAVRDFGDVKKGDLGGWIESEKNLSHDGFCWVGEDAVVHENATVRENARISGNALVCVNARIRGNVVVKENARVGGNAHIKGNVVVKGNDLVSGNARIGSLEDIFTVSRVGSKDVILTAYRTKNSGVDVTIGCFIGPLDKFTKAVNNTYGNSQEGKEYRALIELLRTRFSV